jgi:phage terminase small subunit
MTTRPKKQKQLPAVLPETPGPSVGALENAMPDLGAMQVALTGKEERFAQLFVLYNNATQAYIDAFGFEGVRQTASVLAWAVGARPHVVRRVREYRSAAAAATVIDFAAILEHDRAIVEGFEHVEEISRHVHEACRYCHGNNNNYQWRDFEEYLDALKRTDQENAKRTELGLREYPMPRDSGGFGFNPRQDPNLFCPRCEGRGVAVTIIADTTKLSGPARAIVKGVKTTANGTEVLLHDIDKAKERLLKSGGYLGDDAASVAKGAAAGAAAGATAAIAAAKVAESMTADEAQRLYQQLA